jgi:hypothetical protein
VSTSTFYGEKPDFAFAAMAGLAITSPKGIKIIAVAATKNSNPDPMGRMRNLQIRSKNMAAKAE